MVPSEKGIGEGVDGRLGEAGAGELCPVPGTSLQEAEPPQRALRLRDQEPFRDEAAIGPWADVLGTWVLCSDLASRFSIPQGE